MPTRERKPKVVKLDVPVQTRISSKVFGVKINELITSPNYRNESDMWRKAVEFALNNGFKL